VHLADTFIQSEQQNKKEQQIQLNLIKIHVEKRAANSAQSH